MIETVHDDDFFTLTWEPHRNLARLVRKARRFADVAEAERVYEAVLLGRARIKSTSIRLLIDQREAVGNNDPAYEALVARVTPRISGGVARAAFLVRSVIGKLQVERVRRKATARVDNVFTDEALALAYLER